MFEELSADAIDLSDSALTERFRELELVRRRADAEMAALLREGERRSIHSIDGHRSIRQWIRAQINCPVGEAARLRRLAAVCDTVAGVGDALLAGHIGRAQGDELARLAAHPRVGDQFPAAAPLLLGHAEQLSFEEFRVVSRRWETLADLDGAERNDEVSHARRTASVVPTAGGIDIRATGGSGLVTAEMEAIFQRFLQAEFDADVAARTAEFGPDAPASKLPRTDAQRRFDAMVAIFRAAVVAPADGVAPQPVLNLLVGSNTFERLIQRKVAGDDTAPNDLDLRLERIESDSGVVVSPADVLAASLVGHVRRVVVDAAGVVVDAGRKRRLFTGVAREMALLLAHECGHLGCTVAARRCEVDHIDEWERDGGVTDQRNGKPRCGTHNPLKTATGLRTVRTRHGTTVDLRADGTPMAPVGRRVDLEDTGPPDTGPPDTGEAGWGARTVRVEYCRLHSDETTARLRSLMPAR
ncbi:MAG: DUF222 domain-containing protein [Ilumatobacteraceae bacterium]